MSGEQKFLLFPVAGGHCAIAAERVSELTASLPVHAFPHGSREIAGVILRQGRVIPLYDLATLLRQPQAGAARASAGVAPWAEAPSQYQVIVVRQLAGVSERAAFTVNGACDLIAAELLPAKIPGQAVAGEIEWRGKRHAVLNLDKLFSAENEA